MRVVDNQPPIEEYQTDLMNRIREQDRGELTWFVCQLCGILARQVANAGGMWATVAAVKRSFVGPYRDRVCHPCNLHAGFTLGQSGLDVAEEVVRMLAEQDYRFCELCSRQVSLPEMSRIRGRWLCTICEEHLLERRSGLPRFDRSVRFSWALP